MQQEKASIQFRKGTINDAANIANSMFLAMEDILYQFIGESSKEKASQFLLSLIKDENNQYSYQNCWIAESDHQFVGAALVYDGGQLIALRKPVAERIKSMFGREFNPEDETQAGEFYIDCIGVSAQFQGMGIGSQFLHFLIQEYVEKQQKVLGLLVDFDNPQAQKLYLKVGFEIIGEKILVNKKMNHLQYK